MGMEKNRVNRSLGIVLILLIIGFALIIMIQLSTVLLGPSKKSCTKKVCLMKFLEGPPAFNDEMLKDYITKKYFTKSTNLPNYKENVGFDSKLEEVSTYIMEHFKYKKGGSFAVLGAGDGEYQDLTIPLEKKLNWKGFLVEPNPDLFKRLEKKGRSATLCQCCVSPFAYPAIVGFAYPEISEEETEEAKLLKYRNNKIRQLIVDDVNLTEMKSQCIPLENLLYASGYDKKLDLLVMDMSGTDLDILISVKLDLLPDLEMVVIRSGGGSSMSDVGSYFLDKNLVLKKIIGTNKEDSTYILTNFIPDEDT